MVVFIIFTKNDIIFLEVLNFNKYISYSENKGSGNFVEEFIKNEKR